MTYLISGCFLAIALMLAVILGALFCIIKLLEDLDAETSRCGEMVEAFEAFERDSRAEDWWEAENEWEWR